MMEMVVEGLETELVEKNQKAREKDKEVVKVVVKVVKKIKKINVRC